MENASQALIIAGAILLAILIIAIGMFIYNSASTKIEDSIANMSTQEIESFNNQFESYKGKQRGSQVSTLIGRLIANATTYKEEPVKVPNIRCNQISGNVGSGISNYIEGIDNNTVTYSKVDYEGQDSTLQTYLTALSTIKKHIEAKHEYAITYEYSSVSGIVKTIIISYDSESDGSSSPTEPTTTNTVSNTTTPTNTVTNTTRPTPTNTVTNTTRPTNTVTNTTRPPRDTNTVTNAVTNTTSPWGSGNTTSGNTVRPPDANYLPIDPPEYVD